LIKNKKCRKIGGFEPVMSGFPPVRTARSRLLFATSHITRGF